MLLTKIMKYKYNILQNGRLVLFVLFCLIHLAQGEGIIWSWDRVHFQDGGSIKLPPTFSQKLTNFKSTGIEKDNVTRYSQPLLKATGYKDNFKCSVFIARHWQEDEQNNLIVMDNTPEMLTEYTQSRIKNALAEGKYSVYIPLNHVKTKDNSLCRYSLLSRNGKLRLDGFTSYKDGYFYYGSAVYDHHREEWWSWRFSDILDTLENGNVRGNITIEREHLSEGLNEKENDEPIPSLNSKYTGNNTSYPYRNPTYKFSFSIPNDWIQIDNSSFWENISSNASAHIKHIAAFQKEQEGLVVYPCFVIQIIETKGFPARTIEEYFKNPRLKGVLQKNSSRYSYEGIINSIGVDTTFLDKERNILYTTLRLNGAVSGDIRLYCAGFIGRDAYVCLQFLALDENYYYYKSKYFDEIINSFKYDYGYGFNGKSTAGELSNTSSNQSNAFSEKPEETYFDPSIPLTIVGISIFVFGIIQLVCRSISRSQNVNSSNSNALNTSLEHKKECIQAKNLHDSLDIPPISSSRVIENGLKSHKESTFLSFFLWDGRIGRLKFFILLLCITLLGIVMNAILNLLSPESSIYGFLVYCFIISFPIIKRWHDLDKPAGYYFLSLIPLVSIIAGIILLFVKGTSGPNQYGLDPVMTSYE